MRWVVLVALAVPWAAEAHLAAVDWSRIPSSDAVAACRDGAPRIESLAGEWSPQWPYDVPRTVVAAEIVGCHDTIAALGAADPQNAELWLLQGIYAWYLHNLEQEGYADLVGPALDRARRLDPQGLRADWFEATFLAQSARGPDAMGLFLEIEAREEELPAAFWWDYALAAYAVGMPAHVARALDLAEAGGYPAKALDGFRQMSREAYYLDPATAAAFDDGQVWVADLASSRVCNRVFSFCAVLPEDWQVQLLRTGPDVSGLLLVPPAYPTPQGRVNGSILLLAVPAGDRPLDDFLYDGVKKRKRAAPMEAPGIEGAVAIEIRDPKTYRRIGGAHAVKIAFARKRPRWPGLESEGIVEQAPGVEAWRPSPRFDRVEGVVQYSVLLDIGELAYEPARADFDRFVAGITVEGEAP